MAKASIYYGEAGSGKTTALLREICRRCEEKKPSVLFVPDQYSLETERAVYFAVGAGGVGYVRVTSFAKTARDIRLHCRKAKPYASDTVKLITMSTVLEQLRPKLKYYSGREEDVDKTGSVPFAALLVKTVSAFKNAGVSPKKLEKRLRKNPIQGTLGEKTADFLLIYDAYNRLLTETLDDKLDDLPHAAELAAECGYFEGACCYFDNFDSFSEAQRTLLTTLLEQCEQAVFVLATDSEKSEQLKYRCITKTIDELKTLCPDIEAVRFKQCYRSVAKENRLAVAAKTPYKEAEYAAALAREAVLGGMRYRDILILTGSTEYELPLRAALRRYEIPTFFDFPHPLIQKPAVAFVCGIIDALSFETEPLMAYLESGFARIANPYEPGETRLVSKLDAYLLRRAAESFELTAEQWTMPFEAAALQSLEPLRRAAVEPLCRLMKSLSSASNGEQLTERFVHFLIDDMQLESTFRGSAKQSLGAEDSEYKVDAAAAAEYSRIWEMLVLAFESIAATLKTERVDIRRFNLYLKQILSGMNLANPPAVLDCLTVGDIERTRKAPPRLLIIVGVNEGKIPRVTTTASVFTDFEKEELNEAGLPLYDGKLTRCSKENFFAWRSARLAREKLVLTYTERDFTGGEQAPSDLIDRLDCVKARAENQPPEFYLSTRAAVEKYLSEQDCAGLRPLASKQFLQLLRNVRGTTHRLLPQTAERLFGSSLSPTALDKMFSCRFAYFCSYGLGLHEEEESDIASPQSVGTIVHRAMQLALLKLTGTGEQTQLEQFFAMNNRQLTELSEKILEDIFDEYSGSINARVREIIVRLAPRIASLLAQTAFDLKVTGFIPREFEREISYKIETPGGGITIKGVADRIDTLDSDGVRYLRVCDYKTGQKNIDLTEICNGLNLQMLLYLFALSDENQREGSIQYVSAAAASVCSVKAREEMSGNTEKLLLGSWYDKHRFKAMAFNPAVQAAYSRLQQQTVEKTGSLARKRYVEAAACEGDASELYRQLRELIEQRLIPERLSELRSGNICAEPLVLNPDSTPCKYCSFGVFCGNKNGKKSVQQTSVTMRKEE